MSENFVTAQPAFSKISIHAVSVLVSKLPKDRLYCVSEVLISAEHCVRRMIQERLRGLAVPRQLPVP